MKMKWVMIVAACFAMALPAQANAGGVRGFKDWKQEKIHEVATRVATLKNRLEALKQNRSSERMIKEYERAISQEKWNLEVAKELSVTDYMVLYLAAQPAKNRFQAAAAQLSPSETAEIMEAYSRALGISGASAGAEGLAESASTSPIARSAQALQRR